MATFDLAWYACHSEPVEEQNPAYAAGSFLDPAGACICGIFY
jgi:hypothetical protein